MKKSSLRPSSPFAVRLAAIMHRQPTTPWNEKKEIKNFRVLSKHIREEDLELVERYYKANWPPRTNVNHLRHNLAQIINNWEGEVDRARIWFESHPIKPKPRVIVPMPHIPSAPYVAPTDPAEIAAMQRFEEERLRRKHTKVT
jgi:hypothetical protein